MKHFASEWLLHINVCRTFFSSERTTFLSNVITSTIIIKLKETKLELSFLHVAEICPDHNKMEQNLECTLLKLFANLNTECAPKFGFTFVLQSYQLSN